MFGVSSVPRIVRRLKDKLGRVDPEQRRQFFVAQNAGAAQVDALLKISNVREAGTVCAKNFTHLDFRIDHMANEICKRHSPRLRFSLAE